MSKPTTGTPERRKRDGDRQADIAEADNRDFAPVFQVWLLARPAFLAFAPWERQWCRPH